LATYHSFKPSIETTETRQPCLVSGMKRFLNVLLTDRPDFKTDSPCSYSLTNLSDDIHQIETMILPRLNVEIVYCHNDLLVKNVVYSRINDDVSFIDFEYADYNYWAYDVANHFVEYAGVDDPNFDLYPILEEQKEWLKTYFHFRHLEIKDNGLDDICNLIAKFTALSHLFWALWSFVQTTVSLIDFDYKQYGQLRFGKYLDFKEKLFE